MRDERGRLHLLGEMAVIVVVHAEPPFGRDDAALALDDFRIEREMGDAIGLELEDQLQRIARKPVLINGDVVAGEGVVRAALRFHEPVEVARLTARGAVEHHVLEEVREAGDARRLVAAARAHPVVERDVGDVAHRPDDDLHAVGEGGSCARTRDPAGRRRSSCRKSSVSRRSSWVVFVVRSSW